MASPARVSPATPVPTHLGRYTILGRVASGGMATVYVGRQTGAAGFERIVAIKVCHDHLRRNAHFASMFLEEARLAALIRHPNVVATLDVSAGDPLYLLMEYVEGGSLSTLVRHAMRRGERLPIEVSLRIVMDALAGLQATHECKGPDGRPLGLVHCDVSPQNVLVGVDGTARITDFGIARAAAHLEEDDGVIKGKLAYVAPEQLSSEPVTERTDLFSMGVVLWELLTGHLLFRERTDAATVRAVLRRPIAPPSTVDPFIPSALDAIVLRALERDPAKRFGSALELLAALEQLPIVPASARVVGEYVRRDVARLPDLADAVDHADTPARPSGFLEVARTSSSSAETHELPTRVHAPTADLLAAATEVTIEAPLVPRPRALSDAGATDTFRLRRVIVAVALLLVGGAAGLLATSSPSSPSPSPSPPAPAAAVAR